MTKNNAINAPTPFAMAKGGTGAALTPSPGGIVWTNSVDMAILAGTATAGLLLLSGANASPSWSTSTFPSTAGAAGTIIISNGTNWIASTATYPNTTTINQLLYSSANNTITGLATATSAILTTIAGVPTWVTTLPLSQGGTNANLTATAGAIVFSTASAMAFTAAGSSGQLLASAGTGTPVWTTNSFPTTDAKGDLLYASAANTISGLPIGSTGNILTVASGLPAWTTATYPSTTTINQLLYSSSNNTVTGLATATTAVLTTSAGVPTWASELSLALGGTNASLVANNGGIFYSTASSGAIISGTATAGQLLQSGASSAPTWSTSTYPSTNSVNTLLYASSANVMAALATANNGVLITSAGGVPSISSTLPTAVQTNITELGTITVGTWAATTISILHGGTGVTAVTIIPTATAFAGWDANSNLSANSFISGYTTTATGATTTTLTVASTFQQYFTGVTTQTVLLPVTSTLVLGQEFMIVNNSTGVVTVQSSGANTIVAMAASTSLLVTVILTSGTTAASWSFQYVGEASGGTVNPGTINDLAYYAASGSSVSPLATANSSVLVTSGGGVPSLSTTLPAGLTIPTPNIVGTATNNNAATGSVGELISSTILNGAAISLPNTADTNLTSISLTAGDWDVWGNIYVNLTGNASVIAGGINTTTNTRPDISLTSSQNSTLTGGGFSVPQIRYSLAGTTTIYIVAFTVLTSGTATMSGGIYARRRR